MIEVSEAQYRLELTEMEADFQKLQWFREVLGARGHAVGRKEAAAEIAAEADSAKADANDYNGDWENVAMHAMYGKALSILHKVAGGS